MQKLPDGATLTPRDRFILWCHEAHPLWARSAPDPVGFLVIPILLGAFEGMTKALATPPPQLLEERRRVDRSLRQASAVIWDRARTRSLSWGQFGGILPWLLYVNAYRLGLSLPPEKGPEAIRLLLDRWLDEFGKFHTLAREWPNLPRQLLRPLCETDQKLRELYRDLFGPEVIELPEGLVLFELPLRGRRLFAFPNGDQQRCGRIGRYRNELKTAVKAWERVRVGQPIQRVAAELYPLKWARSRQAAYMTVVRDLKRIHRALYGRDPSPEERRLLGFNAEEHWKCCSTCQAGSLCPEAERHVGLDPNRARGPRREIGYADIPLSPGAEPTIVDLIHHERAWSRHRRAELLSEGRKRREGGGGGRGGGGVGRGGGGDGREGGGVGHGGEGKGRGERELWHFDFYFPGRNRSGQSGVPAHEAGAARRSSPAGSSSADRAPRVKPGGPSK